MSKYVENYFSYMRSNGKSEKSIKSYVYDAKSLEDFLKTKGMSIDNNIKDLDFIIMSEFKVWLSDKNLAPNTINRRFRFLRKFFKYMINMKIVDSNCCANIEDTKVIERELNILSVNEVDSMMDSLDKKAHDENKKSRCNEFLSIRDKTILKFFTKMGLRNEELRNIKVSSIKNNTISIIGKGNKERVLFLSKSVLEVYNEYIKIRKDHLNKYNKQTDILFCSYRCNSMASSDMGAVIKRAAKLSNIDKHVKVHGLRHFAATRMLFKTKNISTVQKFLGHSKVTTTQIYLHVTNQDLMEAMQDD